MADPQPLMEDTQEAVKEAEELPEEPAFSAREATSFCQQYLPALPSCIAFYLLNGSKRRTRVSHCGCQATVA